MKRTSKRAKIYTGRDWALVALLRGATKASIHIDRRKEAARRACRGRQQHAP